VRIPDFALERYFARHEHATPHLICASDVEPWALADLLALADERDRARWAGLRLGYPESAGDPELRAEIAGLYAGVEPDEVLCFAGAQEAIFTLMNVVLEPGDAAVVTWPAYQSLHEVARAVGADVALLRLEAAEGWALPLDRLQAAFGRRTRAVVVNAPHNPTGTLPDRRTFAELVGLVADAGARLLSDEVYRLLEHDPADRLPAAAEVDRRAVSIGVMSKAFGLAGLRIGWIASHDRDLLARAAAFKDYLTIASAGPSEVLARIALRAREAVLARSRALVAANLALADGFMAERAGLVDWVRPRAGTTGFPRVDDALPVDALAERLRREHGVLILPASALGHPENRFRLGLGRAGLAEGLERFGAVLDRAGALV
jgi:aspartate/methionine/tyrosine aminotransferase